MTHAYLSAYIPAFPKPSQVKREPVAVKVFADGREQCNIKTTAGNAEYHRRKWLMWERQGRRCCLEGFLPECPGALRAAECTFEHEHGRTAGHRDDRIELPDGTWINGAAHMVCNGIKGSRKIPYSATIQRRMEAPASSL